MKSNFLKIIIVAALIAAIAIVIIAKNKKSHTAASTPVASSETAGNANRSNATSNLDGAVCPDFNPKNVAPAITPETGTLAGKSVKYANPGSKLATKAPVTDKSKQGPIQPGLRLPQLIDLGSTTCIPCKMMASVLDQLSKEYAGSLEVAFININDREKAAQYNIRVIPTQILYDQEGKEFFRHEGFISKEDILQKFREYGITLTNK